VAQKVSVTFACDYDQKLIPEGQHHARRFSLDGRDYEIDLCAKHSQKFDDVVGRYAERARRASAAGPLVTFTPGISKGLVRDHALRRYRDKLSHSGHLTLEDWVLAEQDLVAEMESEGLLTR